MVRRKNRGGDSTGLLLVVAGVGLAWYFLSRPKVQTGTAANPITVAGVLPVPVTESGPLPGDYGPPMVLVAEGASAQ